MVCPSTEIGIALVAGTDPTARDSARMDFRVSEPEFGGKRTV